MPVYAFVGNAESKKYKKSNWGRGIFNFTPSPIGFYTVFFLQFLSKHIAITSSDGLEVNFDTEKKRITETISPGINGWTAPFNPIRYPAIVITAPLITEASAPALVAFL